MARFMFRSRFLFALCLALYHTDERTCDAEHGMRPWLAVAFLLKLVVADSLDNFSKLLLDKFERHSRAALIEEEFASIRSTVRVKREDAATALYTAKTKLERLFSDRINALRKLSTAAENAAKTYIHDTPEEEFDAPLDEFSCVKEMARINESDVRQIPHNKASTSASAVHVNIESYRCDPKVRRDFSWTGSAVVEKVLRDNRRDDPNMGHQFIGTYSGLTRMYPRRRWEIEPAQITIDLFDPRFRPWFVNAESPPKDIVFLLDYSGSVKGPTMHLIKITMMHVLSTLSPSDHFYGVAFSSTFFPIISCHNNTFLPATTVNKRIFFDALADIEEKDQAHLAPALNFSLAVLRENLLSNSSFFSYSRSRGHKLVMLFTDGIDEWPHAVLEEELATPDQLPIKIFGFSMGYGTGQLALLNWLACNTYAGYSIVDSIMDVKPQSRAYLNKLSESRAKVLEPIPIVNRDISWTNLYMEAQGLGPTITISLPVLHHNPYRAVWTEQGMAGVAGIDIGIAELTAALPNSDQLYGFIVDRFGILAWHPQLVIPKTEIHCIRRSACFDASQVKSKAGSGLRVQYGFSDQRVFRLVGLIDSIPTIDMFDIEGNSTALMQLRRQVIDHNCDEHPIYEGTREFRCYSITNTPFSVVIVSLNDRDTLVYPQLVLNMNVVRNPLVNYFLSKRDVCGWSLDRIDPAQRFNALLATPNDECPEDLSLTRAMVNSAVKWADSWPQQQSLNSTCEETPLPPGFDKQDFVISFVHSRAQVMTYFPKCNTWASKQITAKMDYERLWQDSSDQLRLSVRGDGVIAYRTVGDSMKNRLAVVGVQWRTRYFDKMFSNWISANKEWSQKCRKIACMLVSKSGDVVGSNQRRPPAHLAEFDPQLFASLDHNKLVTITSRVDAQAECAARKVAPWSSPAAAPRTPFHALVDLLYFLAKKVFWFDLYTSLTPPEPVVSQPLMSGGICRFQKIKPVERCFLRHWKYEMMLNISKQIQLLDIKCSRFARVHPVPGTYLTLIEADRPCPGFKAKIPYPTEPQKLEKCEKVHLYERFQPPLSVNQTLINDYDQPADCSLSPAVVPYTYLSSLLTIFFVLYF